LFDRKSISPLRPPQPSVGIVQEPQVSPPEQHSAGWQGQSAISALLAQYGPRIESLCEPAEPSGSCWPATVGSTDWAQSRSAHLARCHCHYCCCSLLLLLAITVAHYHCAHYRCVCQQHLEPPTEFKVRQPIRPDSYNWPVSEPMEQQHLKEVSHSSKPVFSACRELASEKASASERDSERDSKRDSEYICSGCSQDSRFGEPSMGPERQD
jgi:hypothetical protein